MKIHFAILISTMGLFAGMALAQEAVSPSPAAESEPQEATQADKAHAAPPLQSQLETKSQAPFVDRLWTLTGVFHPAAVHFPIAMILVSAMFVALRWKFKNISEDVGFYTLLLGAFSTIPVSLMGWAFSYQMGYGSPMDGTDNEVFFHRWGGIAVTVLAVGCALIAIRERYRPSFNMRKLWHGGVVASAMFVGLVGHWGGSLTYGEDLYVKAVYTFMGWDWRKSHMVPAVYVENPPSPTPTVPHIAPPLVKTPDATAHNTPVPPGDVTPVVPQPTQADQALSGGDARITFFFDSVKPVLETHCTKCHGPSKQKAKFALHTRDGALAPDKDGKPRIVPGRSADSKLIQLIRTTDKMELMPPSDESKLVPIEVEILTKWIDEGAHWPEGVVLEAR